MKNTRQDKQKINTKMVDLKTERAAVKRAAFPKVSCYGLNAMSLQNSRAEAPAHSTTPFVSEVLGRWLGHEGRGFESGISDFVRRDTLRDLACPGWYGHAGQRRGKGDSKGWQGPNVMWSQKEVRLWRRAHNAEYQSCITEMDTWNLFNFINQCHRQYV